MQPTPILSMRPTQILQVTKAHKIKRLQYVRTKAFRKLPLTTKDINKGFYKGTRTGSMGSHTKFGGYNIDWSKVRTYAVPAGLDTFKLTPFVTERIDRPEGDYEGYEGGPRGPTLYLERWKAENGLD